MKEPRKVRRRRADGEESRRRILDAAAEIAGERGYDGTSIAAVSARSGVSASSIYWYFADKDALIAAVIERSFERWLAAVSVPGEQTGPVADRLLAMTGAMAKALLETPDFVRLGMMLALERRPAEATARTKFLQVRALAHHFVEEVFVSLAPELPATSIRRLTTYAVAAADGLVIAREIDGDSLDLVALLELHAHALVGLVTRELAIQP